MLYVAWVVLHRNRHIGASERRQLIPHVRFQVPFLGLESQLKSGFACAGLLCSKSICFLLRYTQLYFCSDGSAFAVDFAILRSHFWYRQTVPKMGP